eukprot:GHVT01064776.1.p2 GENE.GHVT01064776.1~~GHVT01064776.1.p2  ORF type:complete len:355 (-),score=48.47 GHVT01064776.1:269-1333(-)
MVGYRSSNLTRLLQESLRGNCRTVFICTMSPSARCYRETLSTLQLAAKAEKVDVVSRLNRTRRSNNTTDQVISTLQQEVSYLQSLLQQKTAAVPRPIVTGPDSLVRAVLKAAERPHGAAVSPHRSRPSAKAKEMPTGGVHTRERSLVHPRHAVRTPANSQMQVPNKGPQYQLARCASAPTVPSNRIFGSGDSACSPPLPSSPNQQRDLPTAPALAAAHVAPDTLEATVSPPGAANRLDNVKRRPCASPILVGDAAPKQPSQAVTTAVAPTCTEAAEADVEMKSPPPDLEEPNQDNRYQPAFATGPHGTVRDSNPRSYASTENNQIDKRTIIPRNMAHAPLAFLCRVCAPRGSCF